MSEWSQMALSCLRVESSCLWKASSKCLLPPLDSIFNGSITPLDPSLQSGNNYPDLLWQHWGESIVPESPFIRLLFCLHFLIFFLHKSQRQALISIWSVSIVTHSKPSASIIMSLFALLKSFRFSPLSFVLGLRIFWFKTMKV